MSRQAIWGTYVGPLAHLRGERAMLRMEDPYGRHFRRRLPEGVIFAQFNNMTATRRSYRQSQPRPRSLRRHLGYGWTPFRPEHWRLDPPSAG